ncbi:guanine nucleotide-binding protein subunit beta-5a-like [Adelges cooleyi]|uniref:guanine nucleotide-binding protein subunit beta-5a-like n=1 Tax=Adelges cooleyi TaxID=133065 RepID=UPI00218015BF|nr:guanine nucleotide-binding protein subunit beta-5a-like [Adelges cooleyi]XP_050427159.1 guanine nucleotide-binding protein subunit beta-5a-like [Adelges cooleyi]XP_050427160.1 guanine nucleotide-binding protein subunit beta-5a-like [Adelges cooleyi]XP_050427161.1 guanine nucleotide-binding protein subunit beta-5a-like [Adelges cooleyi]XP_050427163.1 guanine nucleotide-binding protein subunit beta-5a-like [Adelges cooleyi]XP_050427164.1 guanine nucleotide-binding protein subunit beta-5a-like
MLFSNFSMASLMNTRRETEEQLNDEANAVTKKLKKITSMHITCKRVLKRNETRVIILCCDWAPDNRHVVSSSQDGQLNIWNTVTSRIKQTFTLPTDWLMSCAYSPSGNLVACGGMNNKLNVFNISVPTADSLPVEKETIGIHRHFISCCLFPNTDHRILTGSGDTTVALWDVESKTLLQSFSEHTRDIMSIDVLPSDRNIFVSGGCKNTMVLWDMRMEQSAQTFKGYATDINSVKFHPSGVTVASGCTDATCWLYDLRTNKKVAIYANEDLWFGCSSIDFSTSGRILLSGYTDRKIIAWDSLDYEKIKTFRGHKNKVSHLKRSPDGAALATASWDGSLRIWA